MRERKRKNKVKNIRAGDVPVKCRCVFRKSPAIIKKESENNKMGNDNLHAGHRERLRDRIDLGLENFKTHELIELLLTYSIPRRDTNSLAHTLLRRFKSYDGILSADREELMSVKGVGPKTAMLFNVLGELDGRKGKTVPLEKGVFSSEEKLGKLLLDRYKNKKSEETYIIAFDGKRHIIGFKKLCEGTVNSSLISIRSAVEYAYRLRACSVAVAHNHPGGLAYPSDADCRVTDELRSAFELMGIDFDGHYILSDTDWYLIEG